MLDTHVVGFGIFVLYLNNRYLNGKYIQRSNIINTGMSALVWCF